MNNNQNRTPLFDAISDYNRKKPTYFRIPAHRYENGINPLWRQAVGDEIFSFDLTETPMLDDLHNASGAIKEAEDLAADLWGADSSYFLVNGSTCGNQAMMLTASYGEGAVALPRNAHKSSLMGLTVSGGTPIYITPQIESVWGLHGGITPEQVEEVFKEHPECQGVLVVSPTYFGITSDIRGIAEVCHAHGAILMVDEAHGGHCYFNERLPEGALQQGADMCVQSIHKVLGSLTQSSILHVQGNLVNRDALEANLHLVQSTSPSYILMTSLDMARHDMATRGRRLLEDAVSLAEDARERINAIPGISCAGRELIGKAGIYDMDPTRLTLSADDIGITGFDLKEMLFDEYSIDTEVADYRNALAIVTIGNTKADMDQLVFALSDISRRFAKDGKPLPKAKKLPDLPEYVISPREAYFSKRERIDWEECIGRITAELIAPYPPGIPLIYPGERVTEEVWDYLEHFKSSKKGHLHGPSDSTLSTLLVIREDELEECGEDEEA